MGSLRDRLAGVPDRAVYRVAAVCAVMPVVVQVVRSGLSGWVPAHDAAPTVVRAKFALGTSPTLVGMYTDATQATGLPTYFPGPWQLYWMWGPIKAFGTTWGPLIAMGLLSVGWILLAGWFVSRRLGYRTAIGTLAFLAMLTQVLSPALLASPVPMVAVLIPFATFCFGMWAFAAGDEGVLPALALVANFLLLGHLVLTILVPAIALVGAAMWLVGLLMHRRRDPSGWPAMKRSTLRNVAGAAAVTVVAWLPAVVQQIGGQSGNLVNLWHAKGAQTPDSVPYWDALARWISLFMPPQFWSRSSRADSFMASNVASPSTFALVATGVVLSGALVMLAVVAFRRRDRPAFTVVVLAAVAFVGSWLTVVRSFGAEQPRTSYVQSCWVVAMFVTFAAVYAAVRLAPLRLRRVASSGALVVVIALGLVNLPHANASKGVTAASDQVIETSSHLNPLVVDALRGSGLVAVQPRGFGLYPYAASAVVALNDAGIPVCVESIPQFEPSPVASCAGRHPAVKVRFDRSDPLARSTEGWQQVASWTPLSEKEHAEFVRLSRAIDDAIAEARADGSPLHGTAAFGKLSLEDTADDIDLTSEAFAVLLAPLDVDDPMGSPDARARLAMIVDYGKKLLERNAHRPGVANLELLDIPVSTHELLRWAELYHAQSALAITAWAHPE